MVLEIQFLSSRYTAVVRISKNLASFHSYTSGTRFFIRNPIFGVTPQVSKKFVNFRPRVSYIVSWLKNHVYLIGVTYNLAYNTLLKLS